MFSLCKQSLKYNRRIMWIWKTSPPGIKKKFLKNTYCASAWHHLSNWKLYLTSPQNVKTMHVFCFNFNSFLKTRSLLFTLHVTHRYIQINTKWQKQTKITSICLLFVEDHLLCNLIYIDLLKNTNTSINEPYYIMLITHCIYNNDYTTSNIVKNCNHILFIISAKIRLGLIF